MADLRNTPLQKLPVVVVDCEFTGLDPIGDRICEVGIVRAVGEDLVEEYQTLVSPGVPMTADARAIHGIPDDDLASAPRFAEVADRLLSLLDGAVLVGHNLSFDLRFLNAALVRAGRPPIQDPHIDTLTLARRMFAFSSNRLSDVCDELHVEHSRRHRALGDARATWQACRRMLDHLVDDGCVTFADLNRRLDDFAPDSPRRRRHLATLQEAFGARKTVWIEYLSRSAESPFERSTREIAIWKMRLPRLQAWCHLRDDERVFRVERIRDVRPGERTYEIPAFKTRI